MSRAPIDRTGDTVDRYRIERLLGAGGFGAVYEAQHVHMQRRVALKLLHPEMLAGPKGVEVRDRFLREAQAAAAIGHPGIVQVYDSGVAGEDTFVAMELLKGEDLDRLLKRERTVTPASAVAFGLRLLDAVGAAHRAGIVHRDLKPANIFLVKGHEGEPLEELPLKLLDFGISKVRGAGIEKLTGTGMVMGTPHYMAPEMFMGVSDVDGRADLYAVGAVLYEMLTARTPHSASSYEHLVVQAATTPAPSLAVHRTDLPSGLIEVVDRALRTDRAERFSSAEEFAAALARVDVSSMPTQKEPVRFPPASSPVSGFGDTQPAIASVTPPPPRKRHLVAIGAALLGALALGFGAAWAMGSVDGAEPVASSADGAERPPPTEAPTAEAPPTEAPPTEAPPTDDAVEVAEVATEPPPVTVPEANSMSTMSAPSMRRVPVLAAPPRTDTTMSAPSPMNAPSPMSHTSTPTSAAAHEVRPGRVRRVCGANGFEGDVYLAGPSTSLRVSSGRQGGVTVSTTALRETVQAQGGRILQCFGQDPIPIGQEVDFHIGAGGAVSNVSMRIRCPVAPSTQRCVRRVFESIDFSPVQRGQGDARVGFTPAG